MLPLLNEQTLLRLSHEASQEECVYCDIFDCTGWETRPAGFITKNYPAIGTLQQLSATDNWQEYPGSTVTMWAKDAPIAIQYYPYNRSDVLRCSTCQRIYLSYTEYGGYYVDQRIRLVEPHLIILTESTKTPE